LGDIGRVLNGGGLAGNTVPGNCFLPGACPSLPIPSILDFLPHIPGPGCDFGPCGNDPTAMGNGLLSWPASGPGDRLFGTNFCGPGPVLPNGKTDVSVPTVSGDFHDLDEACKAHDICYDNNHLTNGDNFPGGPSDLDQLRASGKLHKLQACNKQLCDATANMKGPAAWLVNKYFNYYGVGRCTDIVK
jgi:hypothetical protein